MNNHKLTHRNVRNSKFQLLLLVFFIHLVAVTGLAQESYVAIHRPQPEAQRNVLPALELYRFNNLDSSLEQKLESKAKRKFSSLWAGTTEGEAKSSAVSTPQSTSSLSRFAVYGDFGVAIPHGDFSIFFDPNISVNVGLEYIATSQFSIEGIFGYHRFSTFFGGHTNLFQLSGNGKFYLVDESTNVRPFVNGGIGAYVNSSGTARFGGNIGAGILFEVTPHFGIQGSYNFHAVSSGSSFRFSTAQGGVRWRF